ncbi:leucine-rich repeat domain-containing glycoprotein 150 [Calliopsis andreniformis]|uniref:leucine-rich repeat domain-containing glycoprotein 150 n=1 Tax=Calliopsis andreniformis TaxID=337506 RepID=UPI003FCEAFD4
MKVLAAVLLLAVLSNGVVSRKILFNDIDVTPTQAADTTKSHLDLEATAAPKKSQTTDAASEESSGANNKTPLPYAPKKLSTKWRTQEEKILGHMKPFINPKDILLQEIDALDEETSSKVGTLDEIEKMANAEVEKTSSQLPSTTAKTTAKADEKISNTTEDKAIKKLLEAEDVPYEDDVSEDEEDENDGDYDDDGDDENDDELEDDEQVTTQCPVYCRCAGMYAAATTATCSKFVEEQFFDAGIAHLRIENAGQIRLGPHALRSRNLQQLESITIADTKIIELNQTAFDGIAYLFAVNLTRNGLQEINPNIFQNNTQLTLLAISGNPLKHTQDSKLAKHGLFDAPSVTEFDFSNNGLTKLKRTAFAKMPSLIYVNLKGNKLKEIDNVTFNSLESLVDVDLSNNLLNDIPDDLFYNKGVQTLRIAGNNLTTLSIIRASKLRFLDASNNKIKVIAKDDLSGMPLMDQLMISSNGLKRIHQHAFADLDQLTYLDISDNKLTSLTEHHLRTNSRLQVLLMNDNPELRTLPEFKTTGLEYETYSVHRFECSNCGLNYLEEGTFNSMPAITRLNLSRNRLTELPNGLLSRLSSLRFLDLSENIISTLNSNMFRGATGLTKLNLAANPLVTLQVTPFLMTPSLTKLDVSRCALERVWSEARVPLTSLRFLSVRENRLRRITVEELKATPAIVSLDLSHNPLDCDDEFNESVQWLTDHGVTPIETLRYISNYGNGDNYQESDGISQWTDLAKIVCEDINDGPPERPVPHKEKKIKLLGGLDSSEDSDSLLRNDLEGDEELLRLQLDHGMKSNEEIERAWTTQDQEYENFVASESMEYHPWYTSALWPVITVIVITVMVLLLTVHIAIYLAKRRGRGPVIRSPLILRQGLIDNKNCGMVYKPLQEEIATPHVPKRGSFYSSSTFHYDKIVPESV